MKKFNYFNMLFSTHLINTIGAIYSLQATMKIRKDVSATTVEATLGAMLRDGKIRRIGTGRNTRYIRNN